MSRKSLGCELKHFPENAGRIDVRPDALIIKTLLLSGGFVGAQPLPI